MNMKKIVSIILIIVFICTIIIGSYNKYYSDILSDEDIEDLDIMYNFMHPVPRYEINNYKFIIRTEYNIVYENEEEGIIKFFIRGTRKFEDIITDIRAYLEEDYIHESAIYKNSEQLLQKYKDKKIYIIAHSLGATIANRLANTYNTTNKVFNIINIKFFCPYLAFEKENFYYRDLSIIENDYDIVPLLTYIRNYVKSHDIKIVFKTIPVNTLEFYFLHKIRFFYNIYNDNYIFVIDIMVLVIFIITLIYFY